MESIGTQGIQSSAALFGAVGKYENPAKSQMDMNAFLRMFTTQLKYQDPSNPLESYELASQLAQFSSVEKLSELNSNILQVVDYLASLNTSQAINMLGKDVIGSAKGIQLRDGQASHAAYELDKPADVTLQISDSDGNIVRTIKRGLESEGEHDVNWDGCNEAGEKSSDGLYYVKVTAIDSDGNNLPVDQTVSGRVHAFRVEQNVPYLILGDGDGIKLPIGSVAEVIETSQENA